ncbi:MAG TPA: hypothetical protein VK986_05700 [Tepidisphaeraceae bacterium]|nr:hypothetical protein [Tepidisphaeraceae bacterium]
MDMRDARIIELDPVEAPRTSALILVVFAVLGVGFVLVNWVFTDSDDHYYDYSSWEDGEAPRDDLTWYYMMPSVVRDEGEKKAERKTTETLADHMRKREEAIKKRAKGPGGGGSEAYQASKALIDAGRATTPRKPVEAGESVIGGKTADPGGVVVPGAAKQPE